ncbi:MAG: ABC transporter permease [Desulfotomaculales bacterium]|nr:ABC transporter permease [Candidatus Bipolaricaulota bacterium]
MTRKNTDDTRLGRLRETLRQRMIVIGGTILVVIALAALIGPFFSPYPPNALTPEFLKPPSGAHWFGTDSFGRDVFVRSLLGTRMSLAIGLATTILSSALGTVIGLAAGSFRGLDYLLMRLMDVIMAFPALLLAMAVLAAMGRNVANILIALGLVYTPRTARIVHASTLSVREEAYIEAARALGIPWWRILFRHVLPNVFAPLVVQGTFVFAYGVLAEAGLSFVGVGIQPPTPSLGNILGDARAIIREAPWMTFFPGGIIFALVMAINLMGDGFRETLDPRLRRMFKGG